MSENISLPALRVPLVDAEGRITREWAAWFLGMFSRVGGPQGFSNNELYGDAVALQSYDELLERISALEALVRDLRMAAQHLAMVQMTMPQASGSGISEELEKLLVRGQTALSVERGRTVIGARDAQGTEKLAVAGEMRTTHGARLATEGGSVRVGNVSDGRDEALQVKGSVYVDGGLEIVGDFAAGLLSARHGLDVNGQRVVNARIGGMPYFTPYGGQGMDATYSQAQVQALDVGAHRTSVQVERLTNAMRAHGLIGD